MQNPGEHSCARCFTKFKINEILPFSESLTVEFKNYPFPLTCRHRQNLTKTIISFLNSQGGVILIGVDDTGKVTGLKNSMDGSYQQGDRYEQEKEKGKKSRYVPKQRSKGVNSPSKDDNRKNFNFSSDSSKPFSMTKKQMDLFKLMVKTIIERIYPEVDIVQREQIKVEFIDITSKKQGSHSYLNRSQDQEVKVGSQYVIRIIVEKGDSKKLYCGINKVRGKVMMSREVIQKDEQEKDFEVLTAFRRHSMGGIEELRGFKMLRQMQRRSLNQIEEQSQSECPNELPQIKQSKLQQNSLRKSKSTGFLLSQVPANQYISKGSEQTSKSKQPITEKSTLQDHSVLLAKDTNPQKSKLLCDFLSELILEQQNFISYELSAKGTYLVMSFNAKSHSHSFMLENEQKIVECFSSSRKKIKIGVPSEKLLITVYDKDMSIFRLTENSHSIGCGDSLSQRKEIEETIASIIGSQSQYFWKLELINQKLSVWSFTVADLRKLKKSVLFTKIAEKMAENFQQQLHQKSRGLLYKATIQLC